MNEKIDELTKRKKIRKILLLKINDELKEISQSNPTLLINSKTIQEIEKVYNRNNILLTEKSIIYSYYIKTETKIYPPNIKPVTKYKSVEKKIEKSKIDIIGPSYDEEALSPILNFFPQKKNLYTKNATLDKRYTKNNGSIQKFIENNLNTDNNSLSKEDQLNQSTKIEKNNLHKLIERILKLKNNENMEKIIKRNIKKLRKYCYRFRKKKKKNKRNKSHEYRTNTNNLNVLSKQLNKEKEKEYRHSHFKDMPKHSSKKHKNYCSLNKKRSMLKLKTLSEDDNKNIIIKLHRIKSINPKKIENDNINNSNNEVKEQVPNIHEIKKELMHSSLNKIPLRLFNINNCLKKMEINKIKNNKKGNKPKVIIRNASLFKGKEIEKLKINVKKDKKDKIELRDNLQFKSNKKVKKLELNNKKEIKNRNRNHSFINNKPSKIKKANLSLKKGKIKLIDSPLRKTDDISNCNTYYYTNISNLPQSADEKNKNKNKIRKKSKNEI